MASSASRSGASTDSEDHCRLSGRRQQIQKYLIGTRSLTRILGITMMGSSPVFYRIPVTTLCQQRCGWGVPCGAHHTHYPVLGQRLTEGMCNLDNWMTILLCYELHQ